MRVLHFNEGNLGSHILGQGQLDDALRSFVAPHPGVDMRFAGLSPANRLERAAIERRAPWSRSASLDFSTARWHLVQSLRARRQIDREIKSFPPDLLHVHTQSVALALGTISRQLPLVLSVDVTVGDWWGMPAWRPERRRGEIEIAPSRRLERRAFGYAALVIAWTDWAGRAVERATPGATVVRHHPGIDLNRYRPAPRKPRSRPRLLFVGGRFPEKGGADLLAAAGDLPAGGVDVDLVTPADVPAREGVRVHRLGPGDPRLLDLQQQADIFCLPSYGDAAPWAILEAMAVGTPVVASKVGAIPELLDDGAVGTLVPHGERRQLRDALIALCGDEQRRAAHAAAARRRCEDRYDGAAQGRRLVALFEGLR